MHNRASPQSEGSTAPDRGDPSGFEIVRDPLWNTIRLDGTARRIIDTPEFQRLRQVRQLGLTYLVYPGATHARFDHALGVYHLARQAVALLAERGELDRVDSEECRLLPYAALLHDIGHYPFSHALEELDPGRVPEHHEQLTGRFLAAPGLRRVLREVADDAPERIERLIQGTSDSPLQGLVSGSLDLDKIEYLNRDALFCGVPYGAVDVDRLLHALTLVRDPDSGRLEIGIHEKGLSALESLLFAKYQMYRNVYWHHAVRAATVLYQRLVQEAVDAELITAEDLIGRSDEGLLVMIEMAARASGRPAGERIATRWLPALRTRRLPKRALEIPGEVLRETPVGDWFYEREPLRWRLESRLASELRLPPGELFVDYPAKPRMMGLDLLLLRRTGVAQRLTESGHAGYIDLPRVSDELYHSARVFRVFTTERRTVESERMVDLLRLAPDALEKRLERTEPIL
ncbi:MAG: HD domain-containing protein [Gemmatimonadetes bacterium]|nr:HD domain-containing protein [Gemmatimonadota bacterium]